MKYVLLALASFFATLGYTQGSGKIVYQEKMDLHRNLSPERQEMKEMIPQFNTSVFELVFSGDESIYQPQKNAEETEVTSSSGGAQMTMRFGRENRIIYKNQAEDKMIESREFMQKQFLITGPLTIRKWKIGTKQKEILGHTCMGADFRVDSATTLIAWFTTDIPVSCGPSDYQGLPGLILGVDINDGLRTITATEIKLEEVDPSMIIAPSKGKEVTSAEFEKIREEKMKEMHLQNGGNSQMIMIRHN